MKTAEEIRKKICSIFDENSSDANNGQMSVITEDSYSDTIDEVVELFEAYYKEKQIELPSDEILLEMLTEIHKWIKQENLFISYEYLGVLKEWIKDKMK